MISFMKTHKRDIARLLLIYAGFAVVFLVLTRFKYIYGSDLDWSAQHYAIPDYFRNLFYESGQLIPSFAGNLGAGENIFVFSYYGLLSPVILISYLLPFVTMQTYIICASIAGVLISITLFYWWIGKKTTDKMRLVLTIMFALATPLVFHSHRHIMFISYLPFLIMALHFTDVFFEKGRRAGLIIFAFLMIMCNYFFSVSALAVIVIYGVFCWLEKVEKPSVNEFFKAGFPFAFLLLSAVIIAGVLLLPSAITLFAGRDKTNGTVKLTELLFGVKLSFITFGSYTMGLTSFVVLSLINCSIYGKKGIRFLGIVFACILICPLCVFVLNGGMYIDSKVLIPFIPLALLLINKTIIDIKNQRFKYRQNIIIYVLVSAIGLVFYSGNSNIRFAYIADFVLVLIALFIFSKKGNVKIVVAPTMAIMTVTFFSVNLSDRLVDIDDNKLVSAAEIYQLLDYCLDDENNITRQAVDIRPSECVNRLYNANAYSDTIYSSIHSRAYNNFYFEEIYNENSYRNSSLTTRSKNLLFNLYMGDRYWISQGGYVPCGYSLLKKIGDYSVYENENCLPVGYVSHKVMSYGQYQTLSYPQNVEALMKYTIVDDADEVEYKSCFERLNVSDMFTDCPQLTKEYGAFVCQEDDDSKKSGKGNGKKKKDSFTYTYKLPEDCTGKVVMLKFNVDNDCEHSSDIKITINGIKNKLTDKSWKYFNHNNSFEYCLTQGQADKLTELKITMSNADFRITDVAMYVAVVSEFESVSREVDAFESDEDKTVGDEIVGTVDASQDGIFNLSMTYMEGYEVYVDGEKVEAQCVDTAFLGFALTKGEHDIKITYTAPLLNEGKLVSLCGILMLLFCVVLDIRDIRKEKADRLDLYR